MCKRSATLRAVVTERLTAAAEEISALLERTIAEYEEELSRCREENLRKQQLLDEALRQLHGKENLHLANPAEENVAVLKQENSDDPQTHDALCVQVKEEDVDEFPPDLPRVLKLKPTGGSGFVKMCKRSATLRAVVTERLTAAAEEISALLERTIAEYEEELSRCREENLSKQQLLDEALRQLHGKVNATADSELSLEQQPPQIKEEHSSEPQTLRASVTERLTAAAESHCREENQRKQQLLEALGPHRGAENLHLANPAEENVAVLKQEDGDDPQTHDALCVQVKEEDVDEFPVTLHWENTDATTETHWDHTYVSMAMLTKSHLDEFDVTDADKIENIEAWQIAVYDDAEGDQISKTHLRKRTVKIAALTKECKMAQAQKIAKEKALSKTCKVCKMKFPRLCDLKKHLKTNHQPQRPYSCPICQKGFTQPSYIKMHIKAVHMPEERPFGCSVCEMAFKTRGSLTKHMYQHTGRRAFECSVCQDNFKRKYELEWHMLKHMKQKTQKKS